MRPESRPRGRAACGEDDDDQADRRGTDGGHDRSPWRALRSGHTPSRPPGPVGYSVAIRARMIPGRGGPRSRVRDGGSPAHGRRCRSPSPPDLNGDRAPKAHLSMPSRASTSLAHRARLTVARRSGVRGRSCPRAIHSQRRRGVGRGDPAAYPSMPRRASSGPVPGPILGTIGRYAPRCMSSRTPPPTWRERRADPDMGHIRYRSISRCTDETDP